MQVEEILISTPTSDFAEALPQETRETLAELRQYSRLRRAFCTFELFNQRFLSVSTRNALGHARHFDLDIGVLDPQPRRRRRIAWGSALLAIALIAAAVVSATTGIAAPLGAFTASLILGLAGLAAGVAAVYQSYDRLVFYTLHGRVPLLVLFYRAPDRAGFEAFVDLLAAKIQQAGDSLLAHTERLNNELKEHRRLMEDGIISEKRYQRVKQRILRQHS